MNGRQLAWKRVCRRAWATPSHRVVLVAAIHEPDGTLSAETWAAEGNQTVLIERAVVADLNRAAQTLVTTEGVTWKGPAPGCSCNIPRCLRGFNPALKEF